MRKYLLLFFLLSTACGFLFAQLIRASFDFQARVYLSDTGFSPNSIRIPKGTTVSFVIEGKRSHWPASNFHPTHGGYPEKGGCIGSLLDACKALKQGDVYSFTFNKVGTWRLHDHLYPGFTLAVRVVEKNQLGEEEADNALGSQKVSAEDFRRLNVNGQEKYFENLANRDPKEATKFLKEVRKGNDEYFNKWHELTHLIGHGFYNKYGFDGIEFCDISLGVGCYHGVTEQMFLERGLSALPEIERDCERFNKKDPDDPDCLHGVGHALLSWNSYIVKDALKDCDKFNGKHSTFCYGGVFMEYTEGAPKDELSLKDPWKLCNDLDLKHREACASELPDILSRKIDFNIKEYAAICANGATDNLRSSCITHLAIKYTRAVKGDKEAILTGCRSVLDEYQSQCITESAKLLKFDAYANWEATTRALCQELGAKDHVASCIDSLQ